MGYYTFSILIVLLLFSFQPAAVFAGETELIDGYITVSDETGRLLFQTGLPLTAGDLFIDEQDICYEITGLDGYNAHARRSPLAWAPAVQEPAVPTQGTFSTAAPLIAVYHTHTDECYLPSDGTTTRKGQGSIMQVGESLVSRLNELGYQTLHDTTLHDPHDANAYHRSRRTFMKLLRNRPTALFDIHRDSAPASAYQLTIDGKDATRLLLVVGRQNQNRSTTEQFARQLKAAADRKYRGLVRGIFIAHGNYNQDLDPQAMLVEIGSQYNTRQAAEHSAALFADILPALFTPAAAEKAPESPAPSANTEVPAPAEPSSPAPAPPPEAGTPANRQAPFYDVAKLLLLLLIGLLGYAYISTGSWQEVRRKLYRFRTREFADLFRRRSRRNKRND